MVRAWVAICTLVAAALVVVACVVGLNTGNGVASIAGTCTGLAGLVVAVRAGASAAPGGGPVVRVRRSGHAKASNGGRALTGVNASADRPGRYLVDGSGDAEADGGEADTGVRIT
ncbi:hypothetical protein EDD92_9579 [Streptomyces sp. TLI_185]|nr:hypothetical protein EDD92_9579 [Streptomyces sp. TLI_185]